jgi:hypothetical protein
VASEAVVRVEWVSQHSGRRWMRCHGGASETIVSVVGDPKAGCRSRYHPRERFSQAIQGRERPDGGKSRQPQPRTALLGRHAASIETDTRTSVGSMGAFGVSRPAVRVTLFVGRIEDDQAYIMMKQIICSRFKGAVTRNRLRKWANPFPVSERSLAVARSRKSIWYIPSSQLTYHSFMYGFQMQGMV